MTTLDEQGQANRHDPVYDRLAEAAGLSFINRYATWDREPFVAGGSYAVSVHRRTGG